MSNGIECPICHRCFPSLTINSHVNLCLVDEDTTSTFVESTYQNSCQKLDSGRKLGQGLNLGLESAELASAGLDICSPPADKTTGNVNGDSESIASLNSIYSKQNAINSPNPERKSSIKTANMLNVLGKRSFGKSNNETRNPEIGKKIKLSPASIGRIQLSHPFNAGQATSKRINNSQTNVSNSQQPTDAIIIPPKKGPATSGACKEIPLAERLRPTSFDEYFGQTDVLGHGTSIRSILESINIPSIILWGPPGCGKTSLVNIIATNCKKNQKKRLVKLSATTSGINDVKEAVKVAKNEFKMFKRETLLFIDEIHRFNKLQQDFFLSHVEDGTITLIGATTENPSFHINNALLSRCKVIVLEKLSSETIVKILKRAVEGLSFKENASDGTFTIKDEALDTLANLCDGDARSALNGLEMALNANSCQPKPCITTGDINAVLQRNRLVYDKNGDEHYNIISALHKSIRGSDDNAALYWLARMLEGGEAPLYIARRLVRIASEDIGLADSSALQKAVAAYQACHLIGMPECDVILAHVAVYLARAPKSVAVYKAYSAAKSLINNYKGSMPGVPLHLRNAPTKLMKNLGYGKDYKYNPDYDEPVEQTYLPAELTGTDFFQFS